MDSSIHWRRAKWLLSMMKVILAELGDFDAWKNYLKGLMEWPMELLWGLCQRGIKWNYCDGPFNTSTHWRYVQIFTQDVNPNQNTSQTQPAPAQGHSTNPNRLHMVSQSTDPGLNIQDNDNQSIPSTSPMRGRPRRMEARNSQLILKILLKNDREADFWWITSSTQFCPMEEDVVDIITVTLN